MPGKIISIGTALPKYSIQQSEILSFMQQKYDSELDNRKLKALFNSSGIDTRYSVLPDFGLSPLDDFFTENQKLPDVKNRMEKYSTEILELATSSIENTLDPVGVPIEKITHLITVTCTGLQAPGLGAQLIRKMGLSKDIFHTAVNFMGCNAAFQALKIADLIVQNNLEAKVLICCAELCTLHFRPESKTDHLLSNTIFGDGAASVLVVSDQESTAGLKLESFYSILLHEGWDYMGWNVNVLSFEMILSARVPDFIRDKVIDVVDKSCSYFNIQKSDINNWCIHPGGKKILDVIKQQLVLDDNVVQNSYTVLRDFGNMSSPTVLFILKSLLESDLSANQKIFAIGFGPGLSIETSLMSYVG